MVGFWEYERIPSGLRKLILRSFLKDKDKDEYAPENYRTISLLNTLFKLYEAIIHNRLVCYLEKELLLSPVQAGYRPKKSRSRFRLAGKAKKNGFGTNCYS